MPDSRFTVLDAALSYARRGWRIVPVHDVSRGSCSCGKATCARAGKHPRQQSWTTKASADEAQIHKWWFRWPNANVGVLTGAESGVVVVDVDGDDGRRTLGELAGLDPTILETLIHRTGSGGSHLFYRHPELPCSNGVKPLPGIDLRGDNGLIILPPSTHASGNSYQAINDLPVAPLPWLIQQLFASKHSCHKEKQRETTSDKEDQRETKQVGRVVDVAKSLSSEEGRQQLAWALQQSLPKVKGKRHRQVFEFARYLLSVEGLDQGIPLEQLRPIVKRWYQMALQQAERLRFEIQGDFEETWSDFQFAWKRVKYPIGSVLLQDVFQAVEVADKAERLDPAVMNALRYFDRVENRPLKLLTAAAHELSIRQRGQPFSLSCHATAQQLLKLGISKGHKWVYRRLMSLVEDGVLKCIDRGQGGVNQGRKAAQYVWIWEVKDRQNCEIDELLAGLPGMFGESACEV